MKSIIFLESQIEYDALKSFAEFELIASNSQIRIFGCYNCAEYKKSRLRRVLASFVVLSNIVSSLLSERPKQVYFGAPMFAFRIGKNIAQMLKIHTVYLMPYAKITSEAFFSYKRIDEVAASKNFKLWGEKLAEKRFSGWDRKNTIEKETANYLKDRGACEMGIQKFSSFLTLLSPKEVQFELNLEAPGAHNWAKEERGTFAATYQKLMLEIKSAAFSCFLRPHPREPEFLHRVLGQNCENEFRWDESKATISLSIMSSRTLELQDGGAAAYFVSLNDGEVFLAGQQIAFQSIFRAL